MITQDSLFKLFVDTPARSENEVVEQDFFLITQTPPEGFLPRKGTFGTCAHHSLKAVIEGKNGMIKPIKDYSCDWRSRLTYLMTPWGIKKILKKHDLHAKTIRAKKMTHEQKIQLLKKELKTGPLILLIGNGLTKKKFFSRKKALTHRHYITLRGYNDKEQVFYVYDSNTQRETEQYLMKGTIKIPYPYIVKSRSLGATKLLYNYAIAVKY